jgi:outer membrane protein assembly factor BamB
VNHSLAQAQATATAQVHATLTAQPQATATAATNAYDNFVKANGMMFGFDAQHTHANPYERILNSANVDRLTKKWAFQTDNTIYSSPAVVNGIVYIGSYDGSVYALDAVTGSKKWAFQTGSTVFSSPAVVNGVVYIGFGDKNVYAFSLPNT